MDKTENFELNQWEKTDRILMEDFNGDNSKIDAALKTLNTTVAQHTTALGRVGNCQLYTTSYTGNGGAKSLSFPKRPLGVIVTGSDGGLLVLVQGQTKSYARFASPAYLNTISWSKNSVSWSYIGTGNGLEQMNAAGTTYQVLALLDSST